MRPGLKRTLIVLAEVGLVIVIVVGLAATVLPVIAGKWGSETKPETTRPISAPPRR
jgi:hypothetical protein